MLRDIDTFVSGINDYLEMHNPSTAAWTRNDVYAVNALKGQFVGEGGGDEARRSQFLAGLQQRLGQYRGKSVFDDLRQFKNPESPTSVDGTFNYGQIPSSPQGSVVLDPGSYHPTPAAEQRSGLAPAERAQASNTLMIDADQSATGYPLMVGGPQIGYFYPGLTYEIDMHAPGLQWRGATTAPFPGYMLIGRGRGLRHHAHLVQRRHHRPVRREALPGQRREVPLQGRVPVDAALQRRHAQRRPGPVPDHRARAGRGVRDGQRDQGRDLVQALELRQGRRSISSSSAGSPPARWTARAPSSRRGEDAADLQLVLHRQPAHRRCTRAAGCPSGRASVDPGLPTLGTGQYEWQGFLADDGHIHGVDPERRDDDQLEQHLRPWLRRLGRELGR